MKKLLIPIILIFLISASCASANEDQIIRGVKNILPQGWSVEIDKNISNLVGLEKALFQLSFKNENEYLIREVTPNKQVKFNPSLKLLFYDIKNKEEISKAIKKTEMMSSNIPIYYSETKEYMILTSPGYINGGVYTKEAKALIEPLDKALVAYFSSLK